MIPHPGIPADSKPLGQSHWPRVTVIVPVYNQAAYVGEALDSVAGTGYPALEILVINDASRDESSAVILDWIHKNPEYDVVFLNHEHNIGLTKSLNEAIRIARGEYVCLLAGDDALLPNGIADRVRYLLENPSKLAVFADCQVMGPDGTQLHESGIEDLYRNKGMRKKTLAIEPLLPSCIVFHWAVPGPVFMCRTDAYTVVGPYDESLLAEDWDMYLRLAATGRLGFLSRPVARYRIHPTNTFATRQQRIAADLYQTAKKNAPLFRGVSGLRLLTYVKGYEATHGPTALSRFVSFLLYNFYFYASRLLYRVWRKLIILRGRPAPSAGP